MTKYELLTEARRVARTINHAQNRGFKAQRVRQWVSQIKKMLAEDPTLKRGQGKLFT